MRAFMNDRRIRTNENSDYTRASTTEPRGRHELESGTVTETKKTAAKTVIDIHILTKSRTSQPFLN